MAFATNGGARLYYETRGEGDPVLLIPGLGGSSAQLGKITAELEKTHRCIAVDPRGAGRSDTPNGPYTGKLFAADMKAALEHASVAKAHVVGISMGGMIGQELALRHPACVRSLMLVATYATADGWARRMFEVRRALIERQGLAEHFRLAILFLFSPRSFRAEGATIAALEDAFAQNPPQMAAYLSQLQFCLEHDATKRLGNIAVPTLVVTGSEDLVASTLQGRELATAIPGARYQEIPGAPHLFALLEPAAFVRMIRGFIAS